jgi:hypothetical protein
MRSLPRMRRTTSGSMSPSVMVMWLSLIVLPYRTHRSITVNDMLKGMRDDIYNAVPKSGSEQDQRLTNAFGPNWGDHHEQLKKDVDDMQKAKIKVGHNNGKESDQKQNKGDPFVAHVDRKEVQDNERGKMWLGSTWHDDKKYGRANRAGTMLHEISHAVLGTGDNTWDKDGKVEYIDKEEANKRLSGQPDNEQYFKDGGGCMSSKIDFISYRFSNSFILFRFWRRHDTTAQWTSSQKRPCWGACGYETWPRSRFGRMERPDGKSEQSAPKRRCMEDVGRSTNDNCAKMGER